MSPAEKTNRYSEISQKYGDPWIWGIYITLLIISIVESYSASSREIAAQGIYMPIFKQCIFLGVGAVFVLLLQRIDYNKPKFLYAMIPGLAIITVVSLIYVMLFGEVINGARRAMTIIPGLVTLQPAELAKLSIVTMLSYIFAKSQKNRDISTKGLMGAAFVVALYGGLMIRSGLTNTLLLVAISFSMLLIGGAQFKRIGYLMVFFVIMMGLFFIIKVNNDKKEEKFNETQTEMQISSSPSSGVVVDEAGGAKGKKEGDRLRSGTWKNRFREWWNSDSLMYRPITPKNQQEIFSRMAQAHGGVFGQGVGKSRECSRLPLAFSDYIFSIIVEELGLVGGIFVLLLYLSLLGRAAMIVRRSKRVLPSLLVIGMASFITFQALFHMAINVGVFPVSGQPLPLISKGGTSILVISIAFGVMLSVSRTIANGNKKNKVEETPIIEGLDAINPTEIPAKNVWK
ncbi:MAG: FtsW/RodA/SpoVE family cell cycle protein [Muribaculaceae bacterium]|nr:FtsW/RodA/SpoVE family cell cycle protein [Muribaculaceae bacterium]MBQ7205789.1 FtsW/RodA/SpoVE family cell cycle protein [Muribaculaceae bacterium]